VLRLIRAEAPHVKPRRRSWYDRYSVQLERQIRPVLEGLYEDVQVIKARRAELQRREDEWAERERRRHEREANAAAHAALIEQWETDAGAWHRARQLRAYLRALHRRFPLGSLKARFRDTTVDFFDWAQHYLQQVDPLNPGPRKSNLKEFGRHSRLASETLARLIGDHWRNASRFEEAPEPAAADIDVYAYPPRAEPLIFWVPNEPEGNPPRGSP